MLDLFFLIVMFLFFLSSQGLVNLYCYLMEK